MTTIRFDVGNTWTSITEYDDFILNILDKESKYPTPQALALERGFSLPMGEDNGWDGWIRLLKRPKTMYPYFPTGLLPQLSRICTKFGYPFCVDDKRVKPEADIPEAKPIPLRPYQEQAVEAAMRLGRGVIDAVPRSGKTRILCEVHRSLSLPTIWIAPTDRICTQTVEVIESFFGRNYVFQLVGQKELPTALLRRIVICTMATAANLPQAFYDTRQMLVVDEFHHTSARSYTHEIFPKCDHIYWRFGASGTFFRSGYDGMAMHGLLSNTIFKVTAKEMLELGFLVPTRVIFVPVPSHPKVRGAGNMFNGGFGAAGIHEHKVRNQMVVRAAMLLYKQGRKVLILVGTKAQGREVNNQLAQLLPEPPKGAEFKSVEFLSTDRPRDIQTKIIDSYLADQEVKILMGTSLLGEGVDLPNVDALVYARGEKAEVSLTQNAYRVCTAVAGKKDAIIIDFADRHHRKLLDHSEERLQVFYHEPTFAVAVLQRFEDLETFLTQKDGVGC